MDRNTVIGLVILVIAALALFYLAKTLLSFIVDHWVVTLIGIAIAFLIGLFILGKSQATK